jgi:hypothetical protein
MLVVVFGCNSKKNQFVVSIFALFVCLVIVNMILIILGPLF